MGRGDGDCINHVSAEELMFGGGALNKKIQGARLASNERSQLIANERQQQRIEDMRLKARKRREAIANVEMKTVQSSNARAVGYLPQYKLLFVDYLDGARYQWEDVDEITYIELTKSESIGKFLFRNIQGAYKSTCLSKGDRQRISKPEAPPTNPDQMRLGS